jgi:hypothetical protein
MPPLPAGGWGGMAVGWHPRTPSASRGCPWTGPLALEASGTPHACAPAALGPTVPLSSLEPVVRPVFRQRLHLSLPAALPLSWPQPPQPRRLPVPRLPSGRRLACGLPAASSAGQPLARLGEGSRWHGGTRAGGGEAPAGVPREKWLYISYTLQGVAHMLFDRTTWTFINSFADWLSALGTVSAVILALYLARRDKNVRLEVSAGHRIVVTPGTEGPYPEYLMIRIVNIGHREAQITNIGWKVGLFRRLSRYAVLGCQNRP